MNTWAITLPVLPFDWAIFWHGLSVVAILVSFSLFVACLHALDAKPPRPSRPWLRFWASVACDLLAVVCLSIGQGFAP